MPWDLRILQAKMTAVASPASRPMQSRGIILGEIRTNTEFH